MLFIKDMSLFIKFTVMDIRQTNLEQQITTLEMEAQLEGSKIAFVQNCTAVHFFVRAPFYHLKQADSHLNW